jgi:hypothetical protein
MHWEFKKRRDHCGIVEHATSAGLTTIEFNTSDTGGSQRNGGAVARKSRRYEVVAGFIVSQTVARRGR